MSDAPASVLDHVDQVIDACVQLHVEATTLMYIELGKDLTILKFLDLAELLRLLPPQRWPEMLARVRQYRSVDPVFYALHHTAQLFPEAVPDALLAQVKPADRDILNRYGALDGTEHRWDRPFAERLFDPR